MRRIQMRPRLSSFTKRVFQAYMLVITMIAIPGIGYGQEPGSNPDVPLNGQGVPFDSRLNIILLLAGVCFTIVKLKNWKKKELMKPNPADK